MKKRKVSSAVKSYNRRKRRKFEKAKQQQNTNSKNNTNMKTNKQHFAVYGPTGYVGNPIPQQEPLYPFPGLVRKTRKMTKSELQALQQAADAEELLLPTGLNVNVDNMSDSPWDDDPELSRQVFGRKTDESYRSADEKLLQHRAVDDPEPPMLPTGFKLCEDCD